MCIFRIMNSDKPPGSILLYQSDESDEFLTEERCHILELYNATNDRSQSLARARIEPGITTAWHMLKDTSEIYYILEGKGEVELGEDFLQTMQKGDVVHIPKNTAQRITNLGDEDLIILCFCRPAFGPECYESLE